MELKELIEKLNKLPTISAGIKLLEDLIAKEKDSKKKGVLKEILEKLKKEAAKKTGTEEKKPQIRLEDMLIRGTVAASGTNIEFTEDYLRDTGRAPRMPLTAITEPKKDMLKEEYVQAKEYIERQAPTPGPGQTYARMDTPEYIERLNQEQTFGFKPAEEQRPSGLEFASQPKPELSGEDYKRQEAVKEMMKDKDLIKEDYLREKRRRGLGG